MDSPFGMFKIFSVAFPILFVIMFVFSFGIFFFIISRMFKQKRQNDASPKLTVDAKVVSRRSDHSISHTSSTSSMHSTTWHYVTFEVESGDRLEFSVSGQEYGMLMEGDIGKLTFQGTRYLGFDRFR